MFFSYLPTPPPFVWVHLFNRGDYHWTRFLPGVSQFWVQWWSWCLFRPNSQLTLVQSCQVIWSHSSEREIPRWRFVYRKSICKCPWHQGLKEVKLAELAQRGVAIKNLCVPGASCLSRAQRLGCTASRCPVTACGLLLGRGHEGMSLAKAVGAVAGLSWALPATNSRGTGESVCSPWK